MEEGGEVTLGEHDGLGELVEAETEEALHLGGHLPLLPGEDDLPVGVGGA